MRLVYITRFAFSKGIIITTIPNDRDTFMYDFNIFTIGKDAFLTVEEAKTKVEEMRSRRIENYKRKIEQLKNTDVIIYGQKTDTDLHSST